MDSFTGSELLDRIQRARAGDETARNELSAQVRERMKGFFRARAGPVDASDLAQDATFNVCHYLDSFEGTTENQFWKWVYVVAARVAAGVARHRGAQKRKGGDQPLPEDSRGGVRVPAGDLTPSAVAQHHEQDAAVLAARNRLAPNDQLVIRLRDDEGRDWPDVARLLGKNEEAARKAYRCAIRRWAEEYAGGNDDPR